MTSQRRFVEWKRTDGVRTVAATSRPVQAGADRPSRPAGGNAVGACPGAGGESFSGAPLPDTPIQWLSDNGSTYTALDTIITAERLNLVPITTPASSPESNGMSEAFVNTMRRDYLAGADLSSAGAVLDQLPAWFADYNAVAPHSALGYRSPLGNTELPEPASGPKC